MESLKIVSKERTERLAWLAKIDLTEQEKEELTVQLNRILESARDLEKLDLKGVEPTFGVIEMTNNLRENEEKPCLSQKDALANASKTKDGYFVAPRIV
ncbi:MAG: Asp-tRNA(Asn)/Glu-tRNA(Gln) amidotransferase subunit GatC [Candidatus Methanomethylicus sp.]|nr:Asp-tRNA(Asn)/Glu-tRNA(Gln) amidotransferase subunit GatC [Candidatus Methanomethylicus sp.]